MTVKELIERLNALDPTLIVGVYAWEDGDIATNVRVVNDISTHRPYYKGDSIHMIYGLPRGQDIVLIGNGLS